MEKSIQFFSCTTCAERSLLCGLSLSIQEKQAVDEAFEHGIINIADVLEKVEIMKNKEILEQHEQFCKIWQATDGRYKTKLPDDSKPNGKKMIAKTCKADLEKYIIKYYKGIQERKENPRTMKALYPEWIKFKATDTSPANATKLQWVWNTYYADSEIANLDIASIDVIVMKEWFLKVIGNYELSSKKYKEMKSVANMLLDYAVEKRLVSINVSRCVHGINSKKFTEPPKKKVTEQVYIDDEAKLLIEEAERHYKKTHNVACLAICLNFSLALRVGELVALKTEDFSDSTVKIDRQEVKVYYIDESSTFRRNDYKISPHTKTKMGKRELYLSVDAKKYLAMILEHNKNSGFKSDFLLLDDKGERIHEYAVSNVLRELNRKIKTSQKSNHKIRKTCISFMTASGQLTNEEIRIFAGHEDFATTQKYYEFPTKSMDKRADAYEKALSYTKKV